MRCTVCCLGTGTDGIRRDIVQSGAQWKWNEYCELKVNNGYPLIEIALLGNACCIFYRTVIAASNGGAYESNVSREPRT